MIIRVQIYVFQFVFGVLMLSIIRVQIRAFQFVFGVLTFFIICVQIRAFPNLLFSHLASYLSNFPSQLMLFKFRPDYKSDNVYFGLDDEGYTVFEQGLLDNPGFVSVYVRQDESSRKLISEKFSFIEKLGYDHVLIHRDYICFEKQVNPDDVSEIEVEIKEHNIQAYMQQLLTEFEQSNENIAVDYWSEEFGGRMFYARRGRTCISVLREHTGSRNVYGSVIYNYKKSEDYINHQQLAEDLFMSTLEYLKNEYAQM